MPTKDSDKSSPKDWVALVLTVALSTAVNVLVVGITYAAVTGRVQDGMLISENSTQIVTGTFSGIIGVIGSYLGFKAGSSKHNGEATDGKEISLKDSTGKRVTINDHKGKATEITTTDETTDTGTD